MFYTDSFFYELPSPGTAILVVGFSGSGKSTFLREVYERDSGKNGRNVVYLPAPGRCSLSGYLFKGDEKRADISFSFPEGEKGAGGMELPLLLEKLLLEGKITYGTLLLIDEAEAGMHPLLQKDAAGLLVDMTRRLGLSTILASNSIFLLRALEEEGEGIRFLRTGREPDGTRLIEDVTGRTEVIYRDYLRALEEI